MTDKEFSALCVALDGLLAREGYDHLRFALVLWKHQGDEPKFTASNDASTSHVLRMLEASRQRIMEIEIFNDANAGHA